MPKTLVIERPPVIRVLESKASTTTKNWRNGSSTLALVEANGTSASIHPSSPQKSPAGKHQQSSTGSSPEPSFQWQRFHQIVHELPPLFLEHWRELALNKDAVPLDPDWDRFYALDVQGVLRVLTVRVEGALAGYAFLLVGPHLHYRSTLWGNVDMYWLSPEVRAGWTGVKLFKTLIRDAKAMEVVNLTLSTKHHFMQNRVTKLLQRLGFVPIETVHSMRL